MFQVKICGVTRPSDLSAIADAGADAIGLNFYAASSRFVDDDVARQIAEEASQRHLQRVGVFVNEPLPKIQRRVQLFQLDWIQLHGDESPEELVRVGKSSPAKVLRAFRCGAHGLGPVDQYLDQCRQADGGPDAILLDASRPGQYGGTGHTLDWEDLSRSLDGWSHSVAWILAGGLTGDNVGKAIRLLTPDGVDTASGVESSPGHKDPRRVAAFVRQAILAFQAIT